MQTEKQKWVEEVMDSTRAMNRAAAPDMYDAVMSRIGSERGYSIQKADSGIIWRIAASVALLFLINSLALYSYQSKVDRMDRHADKQDIAAALGFSQGSESDPGAVIFGN